MTRNIDDERTENLNPRTLRQIGGAKPPVLDPAKATLIIIDAQHEYTQGKLQLDNIQSALSEISKLRYWAESRAIPVIHVKQVSPAGSAVFAEGGPLVEFLPEAMPAAGEQFVVKTYPNAFHRTTLDSIIKDLGRTDLILVGFMAHMCVDATARAAFDLDYDVFVVSSATADRALPTPDGETLPAASLLRGTMTALNDRFAWVVEDVSALKAMEAVLADA